MYKLEWNKKKTKTQSVTPHVYVITPTDSCELKLLSEGGISLFMCLLRLSKFKSKGHRHSLCLPTLTS